MKLEALRLVIEYLARGISPVAFVEIVVPASAIYVATPWGSGLIAVVVSRIFRPDAGPVFMVLLGVFFVGFAYLLEYYRKRGSGR